MSEKTLFQKHREFFVAAGFKIHPIGEFKVSNEELELAKNLFIEEGTKEYLPALERFQRAQTLENLVELVDGAVDTVYVILHLLQNLGVDFDVCFDEVHGSNMTKVVNGKVIRREDGKILKPATFRPADLFSVLHEAISERMIIDEHQRGKPKARDV